MSKLKLKIYFSDFYNVSPDKIIDYGAFNISLINDLPLFIDPFLLFNSENDKYKALHAEIIKYVSFLKEMAENKKLTSGLIKSWFLFPEVKQNWFGFSLVGNGGRGLGLDFANALIDNFSTTFKNFLTILEENYRRPESVNFYAEKLFMSARGLNMICHQILQQSVSEIIETRKLIEAKNLLMNTDKTISEIGFELGYSDKAYFTNVFKRKSGQTPTEFRTDIKAIISK